MSYSNGNLNHVDKNHLNDWNFLSQVFNIINEEKIFDFNVNDKIVEFLEPAELKTKVDIEINENETLNRFELTDLIRNVIRYSVKTNHPYFRNQLFGQMDAYGLAGAILTESLNTSAYTYEVAPVFSLIEMEIIKKMCSLTGFNDGIFAPGGSISNMYAMALARYKMFPEIKYKGVSSIKPLAIFTSEESHYSLKKASNWLGIGIDNCIIIKTDEKGRMLGSDLEKKISFIIDCGKMPFFVNATSGSTVLGAFDDLEEIGKICNKYNLWLHVDGCHGGSVILSSKYNELLNGLSKYAKSFAWDPHKSLGAPLQCALFLTKEKNLLAECNSIDVNYLFQQDKFYDVSYDTGNKSVQCGRKIDSFKLWLMFKARGMNSFGTLVDKAILNAKLFAEKIKYKTGFRLIQDEFEFTNVCFWYIPEKMRNMEENEEWYKELNLVAPKIKENMVKSATIMVGYSPLKYRNIGNFIRMVFTCFPVFHENDLDYLISEIQRLGEL